MFKINSTRLGAAAVALLISCSFAFTASAAGFERNARRAQPTVAKGWKTVDKQFTPIAKGWKTTGKQFTPTAKGWQPIGKQFTPTAKGWKTNGKGW